MMIIGNPKPIPEERNEFLGCTFDGDVIEIAPSDSFRCCEFIDCTFHGVGPVLFDNCTFIDFECHDAINHGHYYGCDFFKMPSVE